MTFARAALAVALSALIATAAGCGTAVYGTSEDIPVASEPPGASVIVDGKPVGETPLTVNLSRKDSHSIQIQKSGYITYKVITESESNPNAMMLDDIPAVVMPPLTLLSLGEYGTGAGYKIVPDKINAHLLTATVPPTSAPSAVTTPPATAARPAASASPSAASTPTAMAPASATPTPAASPSPAAAPTPVATSK